MINLFAPDCRPKLLLLLLFEEGSLYKQVTRKFVARASRRAELASTSKTGHCDNR